MTQKHSRVRRVFNEYRKHSIQYALVSLIFLSLMVMSSLLFGVLPRRFNIENSLLFGLPSLALNGFLLLGYSRFFLKASRSLKPKITDFFSGANQLIPFIVLQLILSAGFIIICFFAYFLMAIDRHSAFWGLTGLILTTPFLLFWLVKTMFSYLQVAENVNPVQAIRSSFTRTKNRFWKLLAYVLLTIPINAFGALLLGVGVCFTLPFTTLLFCDLYEESGQT